MEQKAQFIPICRQILLQDFQSARPRFERGGNGCVALLYESHRPVQDRTKAKKSVLSEELTGMTAFRSWVAEVGS